MARFNPFPGLRPFEPDEDHLFFGREEEIDELLRRLRTTRFVSVVGSSGSGKSSLVRSGLIPSLLSGFMVSAGSSWRVAIFRPGEDPIGNLAQALDTPGVLGASGELESTNRVLVEATLRRGTLGLVNAVRQAALPADDNVLVVVDQFEELFRFQRNREIEHSRDESAAFVRLLLDAGRQADVPVYVVVTMRSDFVGDCIRLPGLAEAVNAGQYLVPRMSRQALRSAITGPIAVGGGTIAPRLVLRLLNDLGDDSDQLPVLQHALLRTWDRWESNCDGGRPIDLEDYEAVGTIHEALSRHAEEAYADTGPLRRLASQVFKALTDTVTDPRGVRRPTSIAELAAICGAPEADVIAIVETFRRTGRSFLTPPPRVPLASRSIVDISHESLMRCWTRLITWAEEERASAAFYVRLSQAARWYSEGTAGLWRTPELDLGLRWERENHPNAAWAARYDEGFGRAMRFLSESEAERARLEEEQERAERRKLTLARTAAAVLGTMLVVALAAAWYAGRESRRAEANFDLARTAVDQTLASVDVDPARMGADVPQMEEFRRALLARTKRFYATFLEQKPGSREVQAEAVFARFRLAHIDRLLGRTDAAAREYADAIAAFEQLAREHPADPRYREGLGNAWNWLGETERSMHERGAEAARAYDRALSLQEALVRDFPHEDEYRRQLARTHGNRGILRAASAFPGDAAFASAEQDFRETIRLLEPVSARASDRSVSQELARAYNNLASLIAADEQRLDEARRLYERAIAIDEAVAQAEPGNRQNTLELAKFLDNLADLLDAQGHLPEAAARNARALDLLEELARPATSLGIELADARNLSGRLLQAQGRPEATREYERSLRQFEQLASTRARQPPDYHVRFGDLLLNLATLNRDPQTADAGGRLLRRALDVYVASARSAVGAGTASEGRAAIDTLTRVLPDLPGALATDIERRRNELDAELSRNRRP